MSTQKHGVIINVSVLLSVQSLYIYMLLTVESIGFNYKTLTRVMGFTADVEAEASFK